MNVDERERARVLELLRAYGWNATSFQVLEPGFRYWFDEGDACIAYVDTGRGWVVAGAPIAPRERLRGVTLAFTRVAAAAGKRVTCFGTESRFHDAVGWHALRVGDQPIWAPADWSETLRRGRSLREQLRRARAKGVTVRLLEGAELAAAHPTRAQLDVLIARWLATRPMAPMGFLVQVHPYTFPEERRCFVADVDGRMVGFLGVIPIYARGGWFFEDFLSDPTAPNGTIELLVDAGMRAAAANGIPYVTLGLVPLAGPVGAWLRGVRRWGALLYDFDGLHAFKAKFKPRAWDPIYLSYPDGTTAGEAVIDTLTAFSRGGLLGFGLRGWVSFDVAVAIALYRLSERWQPGFADVLTGAVLIDAALTVLQTILYDWPRHRTPFGLAVMLVANLAPIVAAVLLVNGREHRRASPARP